MTEASRQKIVHELQSESEFYTPFILYQSGQSKRAPPALYRGALVQCTLSAPGSEGTLYQGTPGTMYPHCPPWRTVIGCHRFAGLWLVSWGAVRVHCTRADRVQCTLTARADRVHCPGVPGYNAGGARLDCPYWLPNVSWITCYVCCLHNHASCEMSYSRWL